MPKGSSDVLIGLQYGDEGKAKVIDLLAKNYNIVARFNGGANAGHTIETDQGKVALNQIPSAIFHQNIELYIGSGCVVNLQKLKQEIENVKALGIDLSGRLRVSDQASVVQPHHLLIDEVTGGDIGTTKNGIGPAYADQVMRMDGKRLLNIRLGDLVDDPKAMFSQMKQNFVSALQRHDVSGRDCDEILKTMQEALDILMPYIERDTLFLSKRVAKGAHILFEGAQSVMLDVIKGCVPYVTSSRTIAGAAYTGGDLPPEYHRHTIGVAKAIMSRVGFGPFVSEFGGTQSEEYCMEAGGSAHDRDYEARTYDQNMMLASENPFELGIALRMIGGEYGTVTKRPRRVGMLDLVQLAFAARMNGIHELFLTKCDLLSDFSKTKSATMPIVSGYTLDGNKIDYVPGSNASYRRVQPVIEQLPAFGDEIRSAQSMDALPASLQDLLKRIEKMCKCKILGIGTGPKREEYVLRI